MSQLEPAVAGAPRPAYVRTNNWFETVRADWARILANVNPKTYLEVGSYEGASTCCAIDQLSPRHALDIHCVDTWDGGIEHKNWGTDMQSVEGRFAHNIDIARRYAPNPVSITLHKGTSDVQMSKLVAEGKGGYFDFVYIDGSHQAPDVLLDACLGFKLLKIGGVLAFDDYAWFENLPYGKDPLRCPKPAVDAFVNLNWRKLDMVRAPLYQLFIRKNAD